ncbi:hypothetical protein M2162_006488 [Streptomyces sp. SAI-041]|nr:hypothetical protein [Streptomyces sp. SAI-041]
MTGFLDPGTRSVTSAARDGAAPSRLVRRMGNDVEEPGAGVTAVKLRLARRAADGVLASQGGTGVGDGAGAESQPAAYPGHGVRGPRIGSGETTASEFPPPREARVGGGLGDGVAAVQAGVVTGGAGAEGRLAVGAGGGVPAGQGGVTVGRTVPESRSPRSCVSGTALEARVGGGLGDGVAAVQAGVVTGGAGAEGRPVVGAGGGVPAGQGGVTVGRTVPESRSPRACVSGTALEARVGGGLGDGVAAVQAGVVTGGAGAEGRLAVGAGGGVPAGQGGVTVGRTVPESRPPRACTGAAALEACEGGVLVGGGAGPGPRASQPRVSISARAQRRPWPVSALGPSPRTGWQGSPDDGGKAS